MILRKIKRKNGRYQVEISCDTCGKVKLKSPTRCSSSSGQFCSRKCSSSHSAVNDQRQKTTMDRYGQTHLMNTISSREKAVATFERRYGVCNPFASAELMNSIDTVAISRKRHATMKERGTYAFHESKFEREIVSLLVGAFGEDDVQTHVVMNSWDIDAYVLSIGTYIQFDGVYWHGLDRSIDEITQFRHRRDHVIYSTYVRDRRQNEWFAANGLRLVRFTDRECKSWQKEKALMEKVKNRLLQHSMQMI